MNLEAPLYVQLLRSKLDGILKKNTHYSLRSFARFLDMNPSTLSRILNQKRIPSLTLGIKLSNKLNLSPEEQNEFLNSLAIEKRKTNLNNFKRVGLEEGLEMNRDQMISITKAFEIEIDKHKFLSDWIHYALLELTFVKDFRNDIQWMSRQLKRSEEDIEAAIKRLKKLNLLVEKENKLTKTRERITTKDKSKTSDSLKDLQRELLTMAKTGLDEIEYEERAAVSMTMAINKKNIPKARDAFVRFSEEICDLLEEGEQEEVYHLIINLSPALGHLVNNFSPKKSEKPHEKNFA